MSKTNTKLSSKLGSLTPQLNLVSAQAIPAPDTVNLSGHAAYNIDNPFFKLLSLLNTSKLEPQYYRSETETLVYLKNLIDTCAQEDLYLTCQCIVWSRAEGEGMRTISHAASILIAPYLSGVEFAKRFYGPWNKREKKGGVVYRPDDMYEIMKGFIALNNQVKVVKVGDQVVESTILGTKLTNPMKKGFRQAIEEMDTHTLLKYKSVLIDIINLVRPSSAKSEATVRVDISDDDYQVEKTIDAIMLGLPVKADTWETNQSEAGQIVAKAVKEGKISTEDAEDILTEAKAENWAELLNNNKLGILAAIRNIRNILKNSPNSSTVDKLCALLSSGDIIKKGKIFPYQLDIANLIVQTEFSDANSRKVSQALVKGYELAIPNLAELLPGRNLIMLDLSGSMNMSINFNNKNFYSGWSGSEKAREMYSCNIKAGLIAATIAKATNADVIVFGSSAHYKQYNPDTNLFELGRQLSDENLGGTDLSTAWRVAEKSERQYDRVFILSDNECNRGNTYKNYSKYVENIGDPYVYSVDMASYGTTVIAGPKVKYYYGYGLSMFEDIASSEFNPNHHIEKVKQIII